jgi:hypothetical protein
MIPGSGHGPLLRTVEWNLADAGLEIIDALPGAALLDHRHDAPHVMVMLEGEMKALSAVHLQIEMPPDSPQLPARAGPTRGTLVDIARERVL